MAGQHALGGHDAAQPAHTDDVDGSLAGHGSGDAVGGYMLASRIADIQQHSHALNRLVLASYGGRMAALMAHQNPLIEQRIEPLLRDLLEEPDVRAATLHHPNSTWQRHVGPRMVPVSTDQPDGEVPARFT